MHKSISQLEINIQEKTGRFLCDADTTVTIVKEMLFQFQKYVGQIEDQAIAQQTQLESDKKIAASESSIKEEDKIESIG